MHKLLCLSSPMVLSLPDFCKLVRARTLLRVLVSWVIVLLKEMYLNILTIAKNTLRATKAFACVEETSSYSEPLYGDF